MNLKNILGIAVMFLFFIFLAGNASALAYVDSCQTLSTENATYMLNASINATGDCFTIGANNVTLDCDGYFATGNGSGKFVNNPKHAFFTMRNCNVSNFVFGYFGNESNFTIIDNNDISSCSSCSSTAVYFLDSYRGMISNNIIHNIYPYGMDLFVIHGFHIINNTMYANFGSSIDLLYSDNITLFNNRMQSDNSGINSVNNVDIVIDCNGNDIDGSDIGTSYGINIGVGSANISIKNCRIMDWNTGVVVGGYSSNITIWNSIFSSNIASGYCLSDVCSAYSDITMYNTTASLTNATGTGTLDVFWRLNVINPLLANVSVYDLQNNLISSFSGDNNLWVRQFFQNESGKTNTTPHNIQLNKSGYYPKNDNINMNTNRVYSISMNLITTPVIDPNSITGQLVLTLGFGIMGLFAVLTLLGMGYVTSTGKPDPEIIAKIMIGVTIIILMIVAVWTGIVTPP
jgi:hypothetical protein